MQFHFKTVLKYSLFATWCCVCLVLFAYSNRIAFIQVVRITNWEPFQEMLAHISPLHYGLDIFSALVGVIIFSLCCLSLGLGLLWKRLQHSSSLALGITAFLIGEIVFSLIFLATISVYRLTPLFVGITVILGFVFGFSALREFVTPLRAQAVLPTGLDGYERVILAIDLLILALGLFLSAARLGYDAALMYFSHPKIMAVSQLPILFYPKDLFVVSSFHPGILFTGLIQLFGDQSARLLSWINGIAIVLLGLLIGKELGMTRRAQLWFLTLLVTSTAFLDLLGDGKVELISTAPILGAIYWMIESTKQPTKMAYTLVGVLSGFAIIARPYNIFLVSIFAALFIIIQVALRYRAGPSTLRDLMHSVVWIVPPLVVLGAFHLFQNWIWLGSPIAPLTYARDLESGGWQWEVDPANLSLFRLLYPLTVTFFNSPQSMGAISPLWVCFFPFFFIKSIRQSLQFSVLFKLLIGISVLILLIWINLFFTVLEIRYVLFLWIILFLGAAQILAHAAENMERFFRPLVYVILILFLGFVGARTVIIAVTGYLPSDGISKDDCFDNNLCSFVGTIHQRASLGDRVLVLFAYRYYLRQDLFACSSRADDYVVFESLARKGDPDFWIEAYRRGYRFITFERNLAERHYRFGSLPSPEAAPDWLKIQLLYHTQSSGHRIYELQAVNPPFPVEVACRQDSQGIWNLVPAEATQP